MVWEWLWVENGCNGKPKGFSAERTRNGNPSDRCPFHTIGTGLQGGCARPVTTITMRRSSTARMATSTKTVTTSKRSSVSAPHCLIARSVWKVPCASVSGKGTRFLFSGDIRGKNTCCRSLWTRKLSKRWEWWMLHSPGSQLEAQNQGGL